MSLELYPGAPGDARNAQALAVASDLAYLAQAEGGPAYKEKLGMEATLFSVGNTQAYVAQNDQHIVVAFRGTESPLTLDGLKDWLLTNAANFLMVPEGRMGTDFAAAGVGARFHQGFITAIADVWNPVYGAVEAELKKSDRPLWLTGHSLGGALALLAAWLFYRKTMDVHQVYTYGGPMVDNDLAAKAINEVYGSKIFRYVDVVDPVPKLPTVSLADNEYRHCDKEIGLGEIAQGASSALEFFKGLLSQTVKGVLNATVMEDLWKGVLARVNSHLMTNYQKRITGT
jgi:hypothetical protein